MAVDPGPYDLDTTGLILGPRGDATPKALTPSFYGELDSEFGGFAGHVLVSKHSFREAWGTWEMHPKGDEIVYLLSGNVDFVLWQNGREKALRVDQAGSCIAVPKGVWHTVRPREATTLLFFTPGEDTQHAETPPASGTS